MSNTSINSHLDAGDGIKKTVWYGDAVALKKGEGVCYNTDYGTATTAEPSRANRVEKPRVTNNGAFAGVAVRNYAGVTGGQFIEIYVPGSRGVPVALGVDTVLDTGLLTFCTAGRYNIGVSTGLTTDAGRFHNGLFRGRGSAIPRQTVTALLEDGSLGTWSLAADGLTLTVTDTTGMSAGDTVVLLGGEDDGTGTVIPGKYTIASVTDGTTLVLTAPSTGATAVDVATTALTCTGYIYTGNPTAICDLLEGDESFGIEFMSPPNAGTGAMPHMVNGKTYICGGITIAADVDVDLAQGTMPFVKKAFILLADLTTSDFTVDLVTNGIQRDGSTALAEILTIDDAGDGVILQYYGSTWQTKDLRVGATEGA